MKIVMFPSSDGRTPVFINIDAIGCFYQTKFREADPSFLPVTDIWTIGGQRLEVALDYEQTKSIIERGFV